MSQRAFKNSIRTQARIHRKTPTEAENTLWEEIRRKQLGGLRFRRQHPVGRFILDFYCANLKLALEVDGPIHNLTNRADAARSNLLAEHKIRVLRFSNDDVLNHMDKVLSTILIYAKNKELTPT